MGNEIGRIVLAGSGEPQTIIASDDTVWGLIDTPLAWSTVAAAGSDGVTSSVENTAVKAGQKVLRYGQVLTKISKAGVMTLTQTGASTLTGTNPLTGTVRTAALGAAANLAAVQAAMDSIYGANNVIATGAGPFTLTAANDLLGYPVPILTATAGVTITQADTGANYGAWGPFDPAASDGRQTIAAGSLGILPWTVFETSVLGFAVGQSNHAAIVVGGTIWKGKIIATTGTHSLANGPTWTELLAALPLLRPLASH